MEDRYADHVSTGSDSVSNCFSSLHYYAASGNVYTSYTERYRKLSIVNTALPKIYNKKQHITSLDTQIKDRPRRQGDTGGG